MDMERRTGSLGGLSRQYVSFRKDPDALPSEVPDRGLRPVGLHDERLHPRSYGEDRFVAAESAELPCQRGDRRLGAAIDRYHMDLLLEQQSAQGRHYRQRTSEHRLLSRSSRCMERYRLAAGVAGRLPCLHVQRFRSGDRLRMGCSRLRTVCHYTAGVGQVRGRRAYRDRPPDHPLREVVRKGQGVRLGVRCDRVCLPAS